MAKIDLVTILFIYNTSLFSGAIAFLYLLNHSLDTPGLKRLASAYIFLGLGSLIAGLGEVSIFPLYFWTNLSFILGIIAYSLLAAGYISLNRERAGKVFYVMGFLLVIEIIIAVFTKLWYVDRIRASSFHLIAAVSLVYSGVSMLLKVRYEKLTARWALGLALIAGGIGFLLGMVCIIARENYFSFLAWNFSFQIFINFLVSIFSYALVKERVEKQLQEVSLMDPLTGIGNRRWMEVNSPDHVKYKDSALMLDLDHFKAVNDHYGHQAGDLVLHNVAREVESILRKDCLFARYGGEEFTVFIPDASRETVASIAERIRRQIEQMVFPTPMQKLKVTVSIGVCWNRESSISYESLTGLADKALYRAKEEGRNRVVFSR